MPTCYRHPSVETGVSCSNCGRPICPDCMTPTPVGMRCPECARQRTKVHTLRSMTAEPHVTYALIAINVVLFLATNASDRLYRDLGLFGPSVANGEYWRLVTSGFLHASLLHILFNMYLLYLLGRMLEPVLGNVRFAALYVAALLAGSAGALVVSPNAFTVGASGAVFGLMGAAFIESRARGFDPFGGAMGGIGGLIVINLLLSFVIANVSVGGHVGGLIGGGVAAWLMNEAARRRMATSAQLASCIAVVVISIAVAIVAAQSSGIG